MRKFRNQVGIIIPSYNDAYFLERCLESLFSCESGAKTDIVVVDDCSTDGTGEAVAGWAPNKFSVIRMSERSYFTRTVDAGLRWAKENLDAVFYLLLNSDTYVTDYWARNLMAAARTLDLGIVGATLLYPSGLVQHSGAYGVGYHYQINRPFTMYHEDRVVPWVTGAAMAIRHDVIEKVGYLKPGDEGAQYDESDRDYCYAATMRGFTVGISGGCIIYHDTLKAEAIRKEQGQL